MVLIKVTCWFLEYTSRDLGMVGKVLGFGRCATNVLGKNDWCEGKSWLGVGTGLDFNTVD